MKNINNRYEREGRGQRTPLVVTYGPNEGGKKEVKDKLRGGIKTASR